MIPLVTCLSLQTQKKAGNLRSDVDEAALRREVENLVENLSDQNQLELLETIMGRGHDESTEFDLITAELKDMGIDEEDIEDLKQLSELMYEFLRQIPALVTKLQLEEEYDLLDNVQVLVFLHVFHFHILFLAPSFIFSAFLINLDLSVTLPFNMCLRSLMILMEK